MAPSNAPFPEVNATLFQNKILPTLRHHNGAQSHVKFSRVGEISTFDGTFTIFSSPKWTDIQFLKACLSKNAIFKNIE